MMGLLSGIKNIFKSSYEYGASDISTSISKAANLALTAIVHPVGFITNVEKAYKQTEKESVGQLVVGGASNALLAVAPFTGAIKTAAVKAVTSTIAKAPLKSAAVGLIGGGALLSSPTLAKTAVKTIAAAPETLVGTGEKIGKVVEGTANLSDLTSKDIKNIAVAAGAGAVLATGAAVAYNYIKDKKEDKVIEVENKTSIPQSSVQPITVTDLSQAQTPTTPITPQTSQVSSGTSPKKRRKGVRKAAMPSVNQSVRVNVINSSKSVGISHTKKYLNRQLLN